MALSIKTSGDLIAVSRAAQSDATTAATLDALILFDENSQISLDSRREHNQAEKTGEIEPTDVDVLDQAASGSLNMAKATPDGVAWLMGFATGNSAVTTPGGATNARDHISKLTTYAENPPYFTAVHRKGGSGGSPAAYERHIGLGINTAAIIAAKGEFITTEAGVIGIGSVSDGAEIETIASHDFTTNPTGPIALTYDPVGADDTERAENITLWADLDDDGEFETELNVTAFSTPNVTVSDDGQAGTHDVRASYIVESSDTTKYGSPSWAATVEALSQESEFTAKAANLQIVLGGKYSEPAGVPTWTGGQVAACELNQLRWELNWNGEAGRCWREGAAEDIKATSVDRGDPLQTIQVDRRVKDFLLKQKFDDNEAFGIRMDAVGPTDSIESGFRFEQNLWWPRCKILEKPMQVADGRWIESGSIVVLKDATNDFATVVSRVRNEVTASYV